MSFLDFNFPGYVRIWKVIDQKNEIFSGNKDFSNNFRTFGRILAEQHCQPKSLKLTLKWDL